MNELRNTNAILWSSHPTFISKGGYILEGDPVAAWPHGHTAVVSSETDNNGMHSDESEFAVVSRRRKDPGIFP